MTSPEVYRSYVEKICNFERKNKERPLSKFKGLGNYIQIFAMAAGSEELGKISKSHFVGLLSALGSLTASQSAAGLFSDAFNTVTQRTARALTVCAFKNPTQLSQQVVQWWLQLTAISMTGVMELARQAARPTEAEENFDESFRDELLQILIFTTEYPRYWFKEMAEAIGSEKPKFFVAAFDFIAVMLALTSCVKDVSNLNEEALRNISGKLEADLDEIGAICDEIDNGPIELVYLEQLRTALSRKDIKGLIQVWLGLLQTSGYAMESFQKDLESIKGLFTRFKEAYYASKDNKSALMHLVG